MYPYVYYIADAHCGSTLLRKPRAAGKVSSKRSRIRRRRRTFRECVEGWFRARKGSTQMNSPLCHEDTRSLKRLRSAAMDNQFFGRQPAQVPNIVVPCYLACDSTRSGERTLIAITGLEICQRSTRYPATDAMNDAVPTVASRRHDIVICPLSTRNRTGIVEV